MSKTTIGTTIDIKKHKKDLGELYSTVQTIWAEILKEKFEINPQDELGAKEIPMGKCSDLEKILLTCCCYTTDQEVRIILTQKLLSLIYKGYNLEYKPTIKIRRSFFIVIAEE